MVKTFDILLDLEKELYSPSSLLFSVSRNDFNTVQLNFVITQDGTPVDLTNKTVELAVKKPSGLSIYQACEITSAKEGKAKLALNQQAYIEYGIYTAEVYIRDTNQLAVTSPFWYQSRTPIFNDTTEEAIQSSNDWSALQEALFAYDLRPKIIEGFPTITPEYIGQMAFDSMNKVTYIASGLTSNAWVTFGAGEGGGGGGNDTMFGDNPLNFTPARIGQMFIDEINENVYIAIGITASDWLQIDNEEFVKYAITWGEILEKPATFAPSAHNHDWAEVENKPIAFTPEIHTHDWVDIQGKPATFEPSEHGHEIIEVLGLQDALDLKADGIHSHDWAEIDNKPLTFAPEAHDHDWTEINGKPLAFVPEVHTHAWVDITDKPATFAPSAHNHDWAEVTNKPLSFTPSIHRHDWAEIDGKPLTFVPEVHTHAWVDITDKPLAFTPEAHNHAITDVTGLQDAIDAKANVGASYLKTETYSKAEVYNKTEIDQLTFGTGEGSAVIVEDNLMSNSPTNALSANQGRLLEETKADAIHTHTWVDITGKPTTFAPDAHTHTKAQITDFAHTHTKAQITDFAHSHDWAEVTGKPLTFAPETHRHDWLEIDGKPVAFNPEAHNHEIGEITGLQLALDSKAEDIHTHTKAQITDFAHNHTWGEVTDKPLAFVPEVHTHAWVDITDKPLTFEPSAHTHDWAEIDGKPLTFAPDVHTHDWAEVTGKPTTFTPSAHNHDWAEIDGKPLTFAPEIHNHEIGEITGLQASLDSKADDADLLTKANVADVYTKLETYSKTEVDGIVTGITEGGGTVVEDNLISNSVSSALSANQGRILNETKADIDHVHDYAPETHNHLIAEVEGLQTELDGKANIIHTHAITDVTGLQASLDSKADDADLLGKADINHNHDASYAPINHNHDADYAPINHNHAIAEVTGLQLALDSKADDADLLGKADSIHRHDWAEIDGKPLAFVPEVHTHAWVDITDKPLTFAPDAHNHTKADITDFAHNHTWGEVTDKPLAFVPEEHTHAWIDITGKPTTFAPDAHTHDWAEVTNKPLSFAPEAHNHAITDVTGLQLALDSKAEDAHTHLWADITDKPTTFTPEAHSHNWGEIQQKPTTFTPSAHSHNWGEIQQKPTTFTPSAHSHVISEVTGLQASLDSKAEDVHTHTKADITDFAHTHDWAEVTGKPVAYPAIAHMHEVADVNGLQTALDGKADDSDLTAKANKPIQSASVPALPTIDPRYTGDMVIDTAQKRAFIANGGTVADWERIAPTTYVDTADNYIINTLMGGLKLWSGTQAQYDAIVTKNPTTLYFITG
jgi:hypothetical protein